jgi:hypothetical protein
MTSDHAWGIRYSRKTVEAIVLCGLLWFTSLPLSWAKTRALIMGVGATSRKASDPNNPDNIAAYLQNFDVVVPLSYSEQGGKSTTVDSAVQAAGDLTEAGASLMFGVLTDNERGQLLAIKNKPPLDELYVHSWGAPAVMEAIRQRVSSCSAPTNRYRPSEPDAQGRAEMGKSRGEPSRNEARYFCQ